MEELSGIQTLPNVLLRVVRSEGREGLPGRQRPLTVLSPAKADLTDRPYIMSRDALID